MDEMYLYPLRRGGWVISRLVGDRYIVLHQDHALFAAGDGELVLQALGIPATKANLNLYFPYRRGRGRCPTLELMELCNMLDPTNPVFKKQKGEAGV